MNSLRTLRVLLSFTVISAAYSLSARQASAQADVPITVGDSGVDYQSITVYIEKTVTDDVSVFLSAPAILSNPDINDNTAGFGDLVGGFKWCVCRECDRLVTLQMKVHASSGDES